MVKDLRQQKPPSHGQAARSQTLPGTCRGLGSRRPPKSPAPSLLRLMPTRRASHLLPAKPPRPCLGGGKLESGARKAPAVTRGRWAAERQAGRGRKKLIIRRFSSGKAGGDGERHPARIGELQGTSLAAGILDLHFLSPHLLLPISIC